MKECSIWDLYDSLIKENDKWNYQMHNKPDLSTQDLFDNNNAYGFIKSLSVVAGKGKALQRFDELNCRLPENRSNHTLSAFLFGIAIRDELHIDMKGLPKLTDAINKNFLYFWTYTCLYHDIAFALEERSMNDDNSVDKSIIDFIYHNNIHYSLLDFSKESELIKNYYTYIANELNRIDHGVAGALLVFDALAIEYEEAKKAVGIDSKESFTYNGRFYSKDYIKHLILISNTIAKHNMWRASEDNKDLYKMYELFPLIPDERNEHVISIDDESNEDKIKLLFLLGLVDTLEPIKNCGRKQNINSITDPYIALTQIKINFIYEGSDKKEIHLIIPNNIINDYYNSIISISNWMNVTVEMNDDRIIIKILKRNSSNSLSEEATIAK